MEEKEKRKQRGPPFVREHSAICVTSAELNESIRYVDPTLCRYQWMLMLKMNYYSIDVFVREINSMGPFICNSKAKKEMC